jgi:hypothetical protein
MFAQNTFYLPKIAARIEELADGEIAIRSAMTNRPGVIEGLDALPPHVAGERLKAHLKTVYIPDQPAIEVAQKVLQIGWGYAIAAYPDVGQYIRNVASASIEVNQEPTTLLITGHAGVGKTSTIKTLLRAIGPPSVFQASQDVPPRTLRGGLFITVHSQATNKSMTHQLKECLGMASSQQASNSISEINSIRRELYGQGCLFIAVDEAQALANGAMAGAAFVNLIAHLRRFGIPVVVIGNFSMCHGILAQHSQNRNRMLADPFVMPRDLAHDVDYQDHLAAYVEACSDILEIDPKADAHRICELTGGGSGNLLLLVHIAYVNNRTSSRNGGIAHISLKDLEKAYGSASYSNFRTDIEDLRKYSLTPDNLRKDLRNPFHSIGDAAIQKTKINEAMFKDRIARDKLSASLTVPERKAILAGDAEAPQYLPTSLTTQQHNGGCLTDENEPEKVVRAPASSPQPILQASSSKPRRPKRPPPTLQDAIQTRDNF